MSNWNNDPVQAAIRGELSPAQLHAILTQSQGDGQQSMGTPSARDQYIGANQPVDWQTVNDTYFGPMGGGNTKPSFRSDDLFNLQKFMTGQNADMASAGLKYDDTTHDNQIADDKLTIDQANLGMKQAQFQAGGFGDPQFDMTLLQNSGLDLNQLGQDLQNPATFKEASDAVLHILGATEDDGTPSTVQGAHGQQRLSAVMNALPDVMQQHASAAADQRFAGLTPEGRAKELWLNSANPSATSYVANTPDLKAFTGPNAQAEVGTYEQGFKDYTAKQNQTPQQRIAQFQKDSGYKAPKAKPGKPGPGFGDRVKGAIKFAGQEATNAYDDSTAGRVFRNVNPIAAGAIHVGRAANNTDMGRGLLGALSGIDVALAPYKGAMKYGPSTWEALTHDPKKDIVKQGDSTMLSGDARRHLRDNPNAYHFDSADWQRQRQNNRNPGGNRPSNPFGGKQVQQAGQGVDSRLDYLKRMFHFGGK